MADDDVTRITTKLADLTEWVRTYPLPEDVRRRMTYREFHEEFEAKKVELGLDYPSILATYGHNRDVCHWLEQLGMILDNRELMAQDHHVDLPLHFQWMPEYELMREAEADFWKTEGSKPYGVVDMSPLMDIVRKYAPNMRLH